MPTIAHFDLPADELGRAKKFYEKLFGWKFTSVPGMPMPYYLIETKDLKGKASVGGGLGPRGAPDQKIVNYIGVKSVEEDMAKVKKLGGKIIMPKAPVPGWGYLAICTDTEGNTFGLWEEDKNAK
jgi:predicted enzyme related to lactoylglutathione lyase